MEIRAKYKNARMAPRKIRQYRDAIRGLSATEALAQLRFMHGQAPEILRDVLQSAVANALHNYDIPVANLKVADIIIDGGFALKRFRPVSRGMAHPILKRTSHVTIVVSDTTNLGKTTKSKRKTEIQELTVEDVVAGKVGGEEPLESDVTPHDDSKPEGIGQHKSKQEEARGKMNIIQKGGDPKKTHRRKSLGG